MAEGSSLWGSCASESSLSLLLGPGAEPPAKALREMGKLTTHQSPVHSVS